MKSGKDDASAAARAVLGGPTMNEGGTMTFRVASSMLVICALGVTACQGGEGGSSESSNGSGGGGDGGRNGVGEGGDGEGAGAGGPSSSGSNASGGDTTIATTGGSTSPATTGVSSSSGPSCDADGTACNSNGDCCGGMCVGVDDDSAVCASACSDSDDCASSSCCAPLDGGGGACISVAVGEAHGYCGNDCNDGDNSCESLEEGRYCDGGLWHTYSCEEACDGAGYAYSVGCHDDGEGLEQCWCDDSPPCADDTLACGGESIYECDQGFWREYDCYELCVDAGYAGFDSCGPYNGADTCFCTDEPTTTTSSSGSGSNDQCQDSYDCPGDCEGDGYVCCPICKSSPSGNYCGLSCYGF